MRSSQKSRRRQPASAVGSHHPFRARGRKKSPLASALSAHGLPFQGGYDRSPLIGEYFPFHRFSMEVEKVAAKNSPSTVDTASNR